MNETAPKKKGEDGRAHAVEADEVLDDMMQVRKAGAPDYVLGLLDAIEQHPAAEPLLTLFKRSDDEALRLQRKHVRTSKVGIVAGTVALVLAIAQLATHGWIEELHHEERAWVFFGLESIAIIITAVCVVPGIVNERHERWMRARYRAELLRLAKWSLVVDPSLSKLSPGELASRIRSGVEASLVPVLESRACVEAPVAIPTETPSAPDLRGLLDFYRNNRLAAQIAYFGRKAHERERRPSARATLVPTFFLASLSLVAIHLLLEGFALPLEVHALALGSYVFLILGTLGPAVWAGVRTWRTALEITRNSMRAEAKHEALSSYEVRLRENIRADEAFGLLACCEGLFAQEQGEWLRLMIEAETYS